MSIQLEVSVLRAEGLPVVPTKFSTKKLNCNTYVELALAGQKWKSKTVKHNRSPNYQEVHTFTLEQPLTSGNTLDVSIYHDGRTGKTRIGRAQVQLGALPGVKIDKKFHKLEGQKGPAGRVNLQLKYTDPDAASRPATSGGTAAGGGGGGGGGEVDAGAVEADVAQRKQNDALVKQDILLSTKPTRFQVRIKIIQARSLQANNAVDPIAKVVIMGQRRQTRKKRSTFSPWFNEMLYFAFLESPAKLLDQAVEFEVCNSRSIRRDALLGSFKLDLGLVRQQQDHTFSRKWLMLSDKKDPSAGVKGYLKVSISVLAEGEEAPVEEEPIQDESENMEENMLRPLGVQSEPVDLVLKVFKGRDMPRTDVSYQTGSKLIDKLTRQDDKEYCDPYVVASFSGKAVKSGVQSNTYNPVWMQEMTVPALLPSMCDALSVRLRDSDVGFSRDSDDVIGTYALPLSHISMSSGTGMGFLPCFGPAWVNLYGAPREYELLSTTHADDLNDGIGEGVAYRGRVMFELVSQPGGDPDREDGVIELPEYEEPRVDSFDASKEYKLRVEIIDLNMLSDQIASGPIQVELSMGNYGNCTDDTTANEVIPGTSLTAPMKAMTDGSNYRFMTWEEKHPLIELADGLVWEDVEYRIETYNMFRQNAADFERKVTAVQEYLYDKQSWDTPKTPAEQNVQTQKNNNIYFLVIHALEDYVRASNTPMPSLPAEQFTKLDYNLREMRQQKRKEAVAAAKYLRTHPAHPQLKDGTPKNPGGLDEQIKARGLDAIDEDLLVELQSLHRRITELAYDPQLSLPDAIISVLTKSKRKAYLRLPVADLFYHPEPLYRGTDFGALKTAFLKSPRPYKGKHNIAADVPAQIQYRAWFGPAATEDRWPSKPENVVLVSETYENESLKFGKWGDPVFGKAWSDELGKEERKQEEVELPPQYQWTAEQWALAPAIVEVDPDASMDTVLEEIWQNQRWFPVKGWTSPGAHPQFSDADADISFPVPKGDPPHILADAIELRHGWKWDGAQTSGAVLTQGAPWKIDHGRPADNHGWSYGVSWSSTFVPIKKKHKHVVRKRRWTRKRVRYTPSPEELEAAAIEAAASKERRDTLLPDDEALAEEGWEYNFKFDTNQSWHSQKRQMDFARRRRWHRLAVKAADSGGGGELATLAGESTDSTPLLDNEADQDQDKKDMEKMYCVGRFMLYDEPRSEIEYELRAHIYQGRNLIAEDENGLSDPFVNVIFGHRSGGTLIQSLNLCPTWDQTVQLSGLVLHGGHKARIESCLGALKFMDAELVAAFAKIDDAFAALGPEANPFERESKKARVLQRHEDKKVELERTMMEAFPRVILEVFDHDPGRNDFLGRAVVSPTRLKLRSGANAEPAILTWIKVDRHGAPAGEICCAFELIPARDCPDFPMPAPMRVRDTIKDKFVKKTPIPDDIRPEVELTRIDILAWGLRRLGKYQRFAVGCPKVTVECGGTSEDTPKMARVKEINNFGDDAKEPKYCIISLELLLPIKLCYAPPLNLRLYDNRKFGRKPLVGVASVANVREFMVKPGGRAADSDWLAVVGDPEPTTGRRMRLGTMAQLQGAANQRDMIVNELHKKNSTKGGRGIRSKLMRASLSKTYGDPEFVDDTVDWWTKYFSSPNATGAAGRVKIGPAFGGNKLRILQKELEDETSTFDVAKKHRYIASESIKSFEMVRGKAHDLHSSGIFKGDIAVFDAEKTAADVTKWDRLPQQGNVDCVVRVYLVKGLDLMPKDDNGRADPYAKITLGKKKVVVNDRKAYLPSTLNPIFGRHFQFEACIPLESDITISIYDYDTISQDDLIGETVIDLEDRLLSRVRPQCGLPQTYTMAQPDPWRDLQTPFELLEEYCAKYGHPSPKRSVVERAIEWTTRPPPTVTVGAKVFTADFHNPAVEMKWPAESRYKKLRELWEANQDDEDECELMYQNAALRALHAAGLAPEHIETRSLYSPIQPGFVQGKIEMWVDIFPKIEGESTNLPEPVDIAPRVPDEYELRICVYNVDEAILDEANASGERMSDLYIKSFLRGMESERQKTDVHYRSLNGEGNFNWRLLHKFFYLPAEENIVVKKKKSAFSWNKEEMRVPAALCLQIWDNDLFGKDDFLGEIELKLTDFIKPEAMSRDAILYREGDKPHDNVNLFKARRATGWVATQGFERTNPEWETTPDGLRRKKFIMAGKIEVEIELLTAAEAALKLAGKGRKEPNMFPTLEKPVRPATSFNWLTSPLKALRYILWKNYWQYLLALLFLGVCIAYLVIFLYHSPYFMNEKSFEGDQAAGGGGGGGTNSE